MDDQQEMLEKLAYSLGFFLGDGFLYHGASHSSFQVRFEKPDMDCLEKVSEQMKQAFGNGGNLRTRERNGSASIGVLIVCCTEAYHWFSAVTLMKTLFPKEYFRSSDTVRREVLAGLMDADGSAEHAKGRLNVIRFVNTSLALAKAVADLGDSLGIQHHDSLLHNKSVAKGREYETDLYRVSFNKESFAKRAYFCSSRKQNRIDEAFPTLPRDYSKEVGR